jgi:preprotein translocase subunit YajC
MRKFIKENWFRVCILFIMLIIALSVVYYLIIFIPNKEAQKTEEQKQQVEYNRKLNLLGCIAGVDNKWSDYILSLPKNSAEIRQFESEGISPAQQVEIDNCNKEYSQ